MKLFAEKGFQEVSVNDIASLARVGKGTIYTYFSEKEEILEACVSFIFESFVGNVKEALNTGDSLEGFLSIFVERFLVDVHVNSRVLFAFHRRVHRDKNRYESVVGEYRKIMKEFYDRYRDEINLSFSTTYSLFTSFLMASYLSYESIEPELLKDIIKRGLLCALSA